MITLTEDEKRMVFQLEGCHRYDAIQEIAVFCRYTRDHDKRITAENLLKKFCDLSEDDCRELICAIQRNYHLPWKARTVGEMIAVARQESGARKLEGHDIMALERFDPEVTHFLESVYVAGIDLSDRSIEHHAKCIERSHRMLKLLDTSIDLLRTKHKNGENYYWLLYYSFLSPQQLRNVEEIIEKLRPHIRDISFRTYYRRRREAIDALSSILWRYTSKDSIDILEKFFPDDKDSGEQK